MTEYFTFTDTKGREQNCCHKLRPCMNHFEESGDMFASVERMKWLKDAVVCMQIGEDIKKSGLYATKRLSDGKEYTTCLYTQNWTIGEFLNLACLSFTRAERDIAAEQRQELEQDEQGWQEVDGRQEEIDRRLDMLIIDAVVKAKVKDEQQIKDNDKQETEKCR